MWWRDQLKARFVQKGQCPNANGQDWHGAPLRLDFWHSWDAWAAISPQYDKYKAHPARADRDGSQTPDEQIYYTSQSRGQAAQTTKSARVPKLPVEQIWEVCVRFLAELAVNLVYICRLLMTKFATELSTAWQLHWSCLIPLTPSEQLLLMQPFSVAHLLKPFNIRAFNFRLHSISAQNTGVAQRGNKGAQIELHCRCMTVNSVHWTPSLTTIRHHSHWWQKHIQKKHEMHSLCPAEETRKASETISTEGIQNLPISFAYGVLLLKLILVLDKEGDRRRPGAHLVSEAWSAIQAECLWTHTPYHQLSKPPVDIHLTIWEISGQQCQK